MFFASQRGTHDTRIDERKGMKDTDKFSSWASVDFGRYDVQWIQTNIFYLDRCVLLVTLNSAVWHIKFHTKQMSEQIQYICPETMEKCIQNLSRVATVSLLCLIQYQTDFLVEL